MESMMKSGTGIKESKWRSYANKNDLIIPFLKEIGLNHVKYANPYLHGLGKSYIMKGQLIKGVYHEGQ